MLVSLLDHVGHQGGAIVGGHGEVGDGREGGDESGEDVEQAFLLNSRSVAHFEPRSSRVVSTYNWNAVCKASEDDG
jgi:hypothetical protein